jgi:hypothetical protein
MCAVSVLHDYMRTNVPLDQWTRPVFNEYQEIIRRLDALDGKLDQSECEDPAKASWMREVEERLRKLEAPA